MSEKLTVVIPNEDRCKPAKLPFGVVTGEGVPDFDNVKSKGKRGGHEYSIAIQLDKKQARDLNDEIMDYWEDNKPKRGGDEPANFDNIVRAGKDEYEGTFVVYAKTRVEFDGKPNVIPVVNHEGVKLDPEEFGLIGKGSEGRVAVILAVYGDDEDAGVSVFLSAVKLTEFAKLEARGGASAFGSGDRGSVEGAGGFKSEKNKKKRNKRRDRK